MRVTEPPSGVVIAGLPLPGLGKEMRVRFQCNRGGVGTRDARPGFAGGFEIRDSGFEMEADQAGISGDDEEGFEIRDGGSRANRRGETLLIPPCLSNPESPI